MERDALYGCSKGVRKESLRSYTVFNIFSLSLKDSKTKLTVDNIIYVALNNSKRRPTARYPLIRAPLKILR